MLVEEREIEGRIRSPTTWKRKCPDSITPAWIGPTATGGRPAGDRGHPGVRIVGVRDERSQRIVAVEVHAVQVVRFALVPLGGGEQIGDRARGRSARPR